MNENGFKDVKFNIDLSTIILQDDWGKIFLL
jgi:hypothetical protein